MFDFFDFLLNFMKIPYQSIKNQVYIQKLI